MKGLKLIMPRRMPDFKAQILANLLENSLSRLKFGFGMEGRTGMTGRGGIIRGGMNGTGLGGP